MDGNFTNNWPGLTHFLKTFEPNGEEGRFSDKNFGGKIFRTKILAKRFSDKNFVGKIFRTKILSVKIFEQKIWRQHFDPSSIFLRRVRPKILALKYSNTIN